MYDTKIPFIMKERDKSERERRGGFGKIYLFCTPIQLPYICNASNEDPFSNILR